MLIMILSKYTDKNDTVYFFLTFFFNGISAAILNFWVSASFHIIGFVSVCKNKKKFWKLWFSKTILYICRKIAPPLALSII